MLLNRIAVICALAFTTLAAVADKSSAIDLDDQLDTAEKYGLYVGYVSGCGASTSLQNQFSSDIVGRFVTRYGASARTTITRAVAQGRKNGVGIVTASPESCTVKLFISGKLWQSSALVIAAEARNLTKLPARFTDRIEVKVDLTRRVGQQIHPALNTCADSVTSEIFKEDLRVLQSKHVWGLGVSKKASSDAVFGRDEIYTGDDPDRKIAKSKCADALVLAGAYFKLLEQAYDEEESTPETRYVLRRALGQR